MVPSLFSGIQAVLCMEPEGVQRSTERPMKINAAAIEIVVTEREPSTKYHVRFMDTEKRAIYVPDGFTGICPCESKEELIEHVTWLINKLM